MKIESTRISTEVKRDIEWMIEMDKLFKQLESVSDEETKTKIENEIREKLRSYRREFGSEATELYYKRLKEAA